MIFPPIPLVRHAARLARGAAIGLGLAVASIGTVAAQAPSVAAPADDDAKSPAYVDDVLETANRWGFAFNKGLAENVLEPFATFYAAHVTPPVQARVKNFFLNLREPATAVNAALLGRFEDAAVASARFAVNTTIGVLGIHDEATGMGLVRKHVTLEQVLCEYKIPEGPYVVLPVLGPATLRDAVGRLGTLTAYYYAMGPIYWPYRGSDIAVQYVDLRAEIKRVNETSLDPYAVQRAAYLMYRRHACGTNGNGIANGVPATR